MCSGELKQQASPAGRRLWLAVALAAATLYLLTAQRGVPWQDSAIFQWRMHHLQLSTFDYLGIACAHPLLIVLGRLAELAPLGELTARMNGLSAICMAIATANLTLLVARLTGRVGLHCLFAAGGFVLAHTVWWLATITESHALTAALFSGELLALVSLLGRPRLSMVLLLGLLNGLGLSTHNLALLALPAYGLTVVVLSARRRLPWPAAAAFVAAWCAGAGLYLYLLVAQADQAGLWPAVNSALFGAAWKDAVMGSSSGIGRSLLYLAYNWPNLALPLAAVGIWRLPRLAGKPRAAILGYILLAHLVFAMRYDVLDAFMFFVPSYLLLAVLAGVGLAELAPQRRWLAPVALASLLVGPLAYAAMPTLAGRWNVHLPGTARQLPYRDAARYWLTPWKNGEESAERFAREALTQLERQNRPAVLLADSSTYWPLAWVQQVEGVGPHVELMNLTPAATGPINADPRAFWARMRQKGATVWVVSNLPGYCPQALLSQAARPPEGVLYRLGDPDY